MTEQLYKIPFVNVPQRFNIELAGRALIFENKWNAENSAWEISIYDGVTNAALILALPLVTGVDLLAQFRHLDISGSLIAYTDGDETAPPALDNLGNGSELYYLLEVTA